MYICRKKLRSQTSDLLLEAAAGQSDVSAEREKETAERRSNKKDPRARNEDQTRKIQEREMLGKVKHSVFPMFASSSHMDQTLVLGSQLYFSRVSLIHHHKTSSQCIITQHHHNTSSQNIITINHHKTSS